MLYEVITHGLLAGGGAPAHQGHRCVRRFAVFHQFCHDIGQIFYPHEKDKGGVGFCKYVPLHPGLFFIGPFVTGNKGDKGGVVPVGYRYAGIGRGRHGRRDTGDHLITDRITSYNVCYTKLLRCELGIPPVVVKILKFIFFSQTK